MKKGIAVTLLLIHLFNVAGYRLFFDYLAHRSATGFTQKLDARNYTDDELVLLKTPLNLPYYTASAEAERVDGEIEIDGVHYNYVKRAVRNDTLYLYCIPNTEKTSLGIAKNNFAKESTDDTTDGKSKAPTQKKGSG